VHVLVDQRGAPLSLHITGANVHDKWLADELIVSIVVPRPDPAMVEQHICLDKGYDFPDVHQFVELERYWVHIKHRRRGEPVVKACPVPEETNIPLAAGSVERTLGWLTKRRSIRVRWCKKADNWLGFLQLACFHILMDMTVYG